MQQHKFLNILLIILILLVGSLQLALADAAPPQQPPAGTIETGGFETNVQMVSEEVLMVIGETDQPIIEDWGNITSNFAQARVDATFWMQNQSEDSESFDVWFPLKDMTGYSYEIENFAAWVDDEPAQLGRQEIVNERVKFIPWATWPVTFPPGETVVLTVEYDLRPTGYMPYGEFIYILETGAGWWGNIGGGSVTVRLPYEVTQHNVIDYTVSENIEFFDIIGTDLIWQFTDLEPSDVDNIMVEVMVPARWQAILEAESAVAENPESADAFLALARAQNDGLQFKYGLTCCQSLADTAVENFQKALALDPENVEALVAYLYLLTGLWFPDVAGTYPDDLPEVIEAALILAPDDEQVLNLLDAVMYRFEIELAIHPENEAILAGYEAMGPILQAALEANPDNERLAEYESFVFRYLNPGG